MITEDRPNRDRKMPWKRLKSIWWSMGSDLFFWMGVLVAVVILMIPQISAVFLQVEFDFRTLTASGARSEALWALVLFLGFIAFVYGVALLSLASALYVVPPSWLSEGGPGSAPRTFHSGWQAIVSMILVSVLGTLLLLVMGMRGERLLFSLVPLALLGLALIPVGCWVDRICWSPVKYADLMTVPRRYLAAVLLATSGVVVWMGVRPESGLGYCLSGAAIHGMGTLLVLAAAWLAATNLLRNIAPARPLVRTLGRMLAWLVLSCAGGELVWILAGSAWAQAVVSYRLYTIWAVLNLAALFIIGGAFLDMWDGRTRAPVRVTALLVLLAALALNRSMSPETLADAAPHETTAEENPAALDEAWYEAFEQRLGTIPEGEPVLLVAASGGGSRAAIFGGLVLEALARTHYGPRDGDHWANHVVLISSVSGGSLAAANFSHRQSGEFPETRPDLRHSTKSELVSRMERLAESSKQRYVQLQEAAGTQSEPEVHRRLRAWDATAALCARIAAGQADSEAAAWVVASGLMDDLCTDFMAPVLRGVWTPSLSRGESLWQFWRERFDWQHSNATAGYARADNGPQFDWNRHPLVAFNACEVRQGTRFVVGFPPFPNELVRRAEPFDREPRSLTSWDAARSIKLGQAVRMSANFPFGFNPLEIPCHHGGEPALVLDGGISDNTGLDTVYLMLHNLRQLSRDASRPRLARIWQTLEARHVVILEIDSGAKPQRPGEWSRIVSLVLAPLQAFGQVGYVGSHEVKSRYLQELRRMFRQPVDLADQRRRLQDGRSASSGGSPGDAPPLLSTLNELEAQGVDGLFHIKFECNHLGEDNVLTAWSLGPEDKASLLVRFLNEQQLALEDLRQVPFVPPGQRRQQVLQAAAELVDNELRRAELGQVESSLAEFSRTVERIGKRPTRAPDLELETAWKRHLDALRERTRRVASPDALPEVAASREAKMLTERISTGLQRSPRTDSTVKELRSAASRLNALQSQTVENAKASIEHQQALQNRFDARVHQNRRDQRRSLEIP